MFPEMIFEVLQPKNPISVFIHKNGKALIKSIETGIQDDQNIEIISGLNEGDEVIRAPYSAVSKKLRNDMPISVEN